MIPSSSTSDYVLAISLPQKILGQKFHVHFQIFDQSVYPHVFLFDCLLMWWAGKCSITESLPELIQQVRQDLAGAPGGQP